MPHDFTDMFDAHDGSRDKRRANAGYLADILWKYYQPASVIDVGCGMGFFLNACAAQGAAVTAVDGDWVKPLDVEIDKDAYVYADLNQPFSHDRRYDMAASIEVAEHIDPDRSESFVDELCALSDVVLFSAGIPGQGGAGHINLRFQDFWAELFAARGYLCYDPFRRKMAAFPDAFPWFTQNTLLFAKPDAKTADPLQEHLIAPRAAAYVSKIQYNRRVNSFKKKVAYWRHEGAGQGKVTTGDKD
jgi:SAM-dependent methyltransferase